MAWYLAPGTPDTGRWWWAVQHDEHPAFYLWSFVAGDFAPGPRSGPLRRHAGTLGGSLVRGDGPVRCGSCGAVPDVGRLEVVERCTGDRAFLTPYRSGRSPWPRATDPRSCWLCSDPAAGELQAVPVEGKDERVCARCAVHLVRGA
jgi:hypothetical protein